MVGVIALCAVTAVTGLERYSVGIPDNPWTEGYASTGETDLVVMTEAGVMPFRVDPSVNLVEGYLARGGNSWSGPDFWDRGLEIPLFDGDPNTAWTYGLTFLPRRGQPLYYHPRINLGAALPVNRVVFYPREGFPKRAPTRFQLFVNDDDPDHLVKSGRRRGQPIWELVRDELENRDPVVEVRFPVQLVKFVRLQLWDTEIWEIAEIEIYGEGYVPRSSYVTDLLDLEEPSSWGRIGWSGHQDPEARVLVRTRSGTDEDPNIYWRKTGRGDEIVKRSASGAPLTAKEYDRLPKLEQGPITYDTDHWSFWSAPYDFDRGIHGVPIESPGPRRYFQVRMDFLSTLTAGARLDSLWFAYSRPPAAREVVAEIWPVDVPAGEVTVFTYALRPVLTKENTGFDSLELLTPTRVDVVRTVRIAGEDVPFSVEHPEGDPGRLVIHFTDRRMGVRDDGKLVEIVFDAIVLRYGTEISGRVFDSQTQEVPQLVRPGDATERLASNELTVRTALEGSLIGSLDVLPRACTPNGDGRNDAVRIAYSLLQLTRTASVTLAVYDLRGRRVRTLREEEDMSGMYELRWDGTADDGSLVPPGLYVARVAVKADSGQEARVRTIPVAY